MGTYKLTAENIGNYLTKKGVFGVRSDPNVTRLGGGVSNTVLHVVTENDCLVVKQPLENLAVEDDWPADTSRVHNEAAAARAYQDILSNVEHTNVHVPEVSFESTVDNVIAITCVPDSAVMWKEQLLDGVVDPGIAESLGYFLGNAHHSTQASRELKQEFANKEPFEQLRLDPYHRAVAERHPNVRSYVEAEIDRVVSVEKTLVHGDFSPKNVLVDSSTTPISIWLLDFEVAHWGDPSFDTAFMLNHLLIKGVYNANERTAYIDAAEEFWKAYSECVEWENEAETVSELAVLMLARVDGKSPVEYVTSDETKEKLRTIGTRALTDEIRTLSGYIEIMNEVSNQ